MKRPVLVLLSLTVLLTLGCNSKTQAPSSLISRMQKANVLHEPAVTMSQSTGFFTEKKPPL